MTAESAGGSAPPAPAGAEALFGESWPHCLSYADVLCNEGVEWGLLGPREPLRIWQRHILNSLAVSAFVPTGARVIDVGSGAGLPGVPLALARPDVTVALVESMAKRVRFLELVRSRCSLTGITIEHARAEKAKSRADTVVCRAVAPLLRLLPLAHRLTNGRGALVALKGQSAVDEIHEVEAHIRQRPTIRWRPVSITLELVREPDPTTVLVVSWSQAGPSRGSSQG